MVSNEGTVGHFSKIYVEHKPSVYYKMLGPVEKYIHRIKDIDGLTYYWVLSNKYWDNSTDHANDIDNFEVFLKTKETETCPEKMTLWAAGDQWKSTDVIITCDQSGSNFNIFWLY